jgi:hypothetical protein
MGFRFRRSLEILPGIRLNIGKRGASTSVAVILIAALATTDLALGADPLPDGTSIQIKDMYIGREQSEVIRANHKLCDDDDMLHKDNKCFTIGGAPIKNVISWPDANRRVARFRFDFAPAHFDAIKAAVAAKYPALKCSSEVLQNRFGAKFNNETCLFRNARETLRLVKFEETLDIGSVGVVTNAFIDSLEKERASKKKDI